MLGQNAGWIAGLGPFWGADSAWARYKYNLSRASDAQVAPHLFYDVLRAYYRNSDLYNHLATILGQETVEGRYRDMHGIRNPANRIVEFYVAHLWPGPLQTALPVVALNDNEKLLEAIDQVHRWSNFGQTKQVTARMYAMLGDMFIKVVANESRNRVFFENLDPSTVIEFDKDERGFLTYARIDVPRKRRESGKIKDYVYTEEWSLDESSFRRWEHTHPIGCTIEQLGAPADGDDLSIQEYAGIDFIPIVHSPFRDVGDQRGVGAFTLLIDKIDEVNRKASRLASQLFRHNDQTWLLESPGATNAGERARVPPSLSGSNEVDIGGERVIAIPGGWTLRSQIPQINYEASLSALESDMAELQQDAPEMAYWKITEQPGELSGRALRFMLAPAIKRAEEARGNGEGALARAMMMALTIAQNLGLPGFSPSEIGTYDNGDFWHEFEDREIIPSTPQEDAEAEGVELSNLTLKQVIGVPNEQLQREAGYTDEDIEEFRAQAGIDGLGNALLDNFESGTGGVPLDDQGNPITE